MMTSAQSSGGEDMPTHQARTMTLRTFIRRMLRILSIGYPSLYSVDSVLLLLQLALSVVYAWSYTQLTNNAGNIMTAIVDRNKPEFYKWTLWLIFVVLLGSAANSVTLSLGDFLCLGRFRYRLANTLTASYMKNKAYFKLIHLDRQIDDPDARIARDTELLCNQMKLILFGTPMYVGYITTTVTSVYFFCVLWDDAGWFVPVAVVVSFIVSTLFSQLLTKQASKAARVLDDENSRYHSLHSYFAAHTEHIAFLNGHKQEEAKLRQQLKVAADAVSPVAFWRMPLNFATMFFYWMNQVLSYVIPALAWLWFGDVTFTDYTFLANVSSSAYSFEGTLTTYLLLFQEWTALMACASRIGELLETLDSIESDPSFDGSVKFVYTNDQAVEVAHVTLNRPGTTKALMQDVSFSVKLGHSVVIMGPSGIGKSSLLRVLGGLWPAVNGTVTRPRCFGHKGLMFVPQKPYLTRSDSLLAQIAYPVESPSTMFRAGETGDVTDAVGERVSFTSNTSMTAYSSTGGAAIPTDSATSSEEAEGSTIQPPPEPLTLSLALDYLGQVGLAYLSKQFDIENDVRDWSQVLSVGEQQRLGLARVLYHRPAIVIMDESTSAIDEPNEEQCFKALKRCNIAMLSVAHRSTVKKFHEAVFSVEQSGTWKMVEIAAEQRAQPLPTPPPLGSEIK